MRLRFCITPRVLTRCCSAKIRPWRRCGEPGKLDSKTQPGLARIPISPYCEKTRNSTRCTRPIKRNHPRPSHRSLLRNNEKSAATKSEARMVSPGFVWFRVRKRALRVIAASGVGMLRRMCGELSYGEPFAEIVRAKPLRGELRRPKFLQSKNPQNQLAPRYACCSWRRVKPKQDPCQPPQPCLSWVPPLLVLLSRTVVSGQR